MIKDIPANDLETSYIHYSFTTLQYTKNASITNAKINLKLEKQHLLLCFNRLLILGRKHDYIQNNIASMKHR